MKKLFIIIPLIISGCTTTEITLNREGINSAKTVLIAPFTSSLNLKKEIYSETEERFRTAFTTLGYAVIDRNRIDTILKDKGRTESSLTNADLKTVAQQLGADTILTGEITSHSEYIETRRPFMMIIGNMTPDGRRIREHREHTTVHYLIKISATLTRTSDDAVLLNIKNRYGNYRFENPDDYPPVFSLDDCRRDLLTKMTKELVEKIRGDK